VKTLAKTQTAERGAKARRVGVRTIIVRRDVKEGECKRRGEESVLCFERARKEQGGKEICPSSAEVPEIWYLPKREECVSTRQENGKEERKFGRGGKRGRGLTKRMPLAKRKKRIGAKEKERRDECGEDKTAAKAWGELASSGTGRSRMGERTARG